SNNMPISFIPTKRLSTSFVGPCSGAILSGESMDPLEKFKTDFARLRSEAHQPKTDKPQPKRKANGAAPASPAQNSLREFGDPLPSDELDDDVPFGITEPRPIDERVAPKAGERIADSATGLDVHDASDDIEPPPPRGWLLGNQFCRGFLSSL